MQYPYSPSLPLAYVQNQIITHILGSWFIWGRKKNFGPIPQVINKKDIIHTHVLTMLGRDISPGLKWWQTIIFIQPMRRLDMHFGGPICLFFWVLGVKGFFCCHQCIPIEFPSSSHPLPFPPLPHHPQKNPNVFPMATRFYPICFAQSWTFIYINNEGKSKGSRDGPLYWGVPNVWKELLVMGQSKWLRPKTLKKKTLEKNPWVHIP